MSEQANWHENLESTSGKVKMTNKKNYRQKDVEKMHGKKAYRLREILNHEGDELVKEYIEGSEG